MDILLRDKESLDEAIKKVVAEEKVIKHCVETVPWEVTESLALASIQAGYNHLFLYRRNALDRLLSLHFARITGIWGRNMEKFGKIIGAPEVSKKTDQNVDIIRVIRENPIPVEDLIRHEIKCVNIMNRLWDLLSENGANLIALAYEDVYKAQNLEQVVETLETVINKLGLEIPREKFIEWVKKVGGRGDQGTRNFYRQMIGYEELARRCEDLPMFMSDSRNLFVRTLYNRHPWISCAFVDVRPERTVLDQSFEIGGVCVLSKDAPDGLKLEAEIGGIRVPLQWGLPSQRMAKEYPNAKNSTNARWRGEISLSGNSNFAVIVLVHSQKRIPLFELLVQPDNQIPRFILEKAKLIFDIGANDGADTGYYLKKGFRVVAVEAIHELAESIKLIYEQAMCDGRLFVENYVVSSISGGNVKFVVNKSWTEWSSAQGAKKFDNHIIEEVILPTITVADLIKKYGAPYYVKIDIEGGELDAVKSLLEIDYDMLPEYISFEVNSKVFDVLEILWNIGYREFQLVRQGKEFLPAPNYPTREGIEYRIPWKSNMSGPFGKDLPDDKWVGLVEIIRQLILVQQEMSERKQRGEPPGWYDLHCRKGIRPFLKFEREQDKSMFQYQRGKGLR